MGRRRSVFVTGGTGYLGSRLTHALLARGHAVTALARRGSEKRLPAGTTAVFGDALDATSFAGLVTGADTFVQLVGTPHPSPAKAQEFISVDLAAARAGVVAASMARVAHFVYVSVAQPAPVMRAYQAARAEAEGLIKDAGLHATVLRPWYVLGPGHRWAYALLPLYWIAESIPSRRETARRLGLVTLPQMVNALVHAVEHPAEGMRVVTVPEIRRAAA